MIKLLQDPKQRPMEDRRCSRKAWGRVESKRCALNLDFNIFYR